MNAGECSAWPSCCRALLDFENVCLINNQFKSSTFFFYDGLEMLFRSLDSEFLVDNFVYRSTDENLKNT